MMSPSVITVLLFLVGQSKPTAPAADAFQRRLADLSSPIWKTREDAMWELMEAGPSIYDPLRATFRQAPHFDTRRRIKEIAKEIYLTEKLGPPTAFLGISHNRQDLRGVDDARVQPGCTALRIEAVFPGTAADRAGLQPGDLLLAMNGKKSTLEEPAMNMTKWIASQKPLTQCRLSVFRGGAGIRVEPERNRAIDLRKVGQMKVQVVKAKDNPSIPDGAIGLRLSEDKKLAPDLMLEEGDLIIGLNDQSVPTADVAGILERWADAVAKSPGPQSSGEMEVRVQNGRAQMVPKVTGPSMQLVRGGKWMDIDVRLGRKPLYLRTGGFPVWQTEPPAVEQATASFETWWTDMFDPSGTFAEQASNDPVWRMEPSRR